jgi:hypothetical protein
VHCFDGSVLQARNRLLAVPSRSEGRTGGYGCLRGSDMAKQGRGGLGGSRRVQL